MRVYCPQCNRNHEPYEPLCRNNQERPRRYVVRYYADTGGASDAEAHIWGYTVEDALQTFKMRQEHFMSRPRYGGARGIEPYREEAHGPWDHPGMNDLERANQTALRSVGR